MSLRKPWRAIQTAELGSVPEITASSEPAAEEAESAVPCLLRPDGVILSGGDAARPDSGLIGEGMAREIAEKIEGHAGFAESFLQQIDGCDGEELVLRGPMRLQRHVDLGRVNVFQRRAAVPDHGGIDLGSGAHS